MTNPSAVARRRLWQDRIERFHRSGLAVKRFCESEGVSQANFYLWKRKLNEPLPTAKPAFVGVALQGPGTATKLTLPGGATIEIAAEMNTDRLTDLIGAVVAATGQLGEQETTP